MSFPYLSLRAFPDGASEGGNEPNAPGGSLHGHEGWEPRFRPGENCGRNPSIHVENIREK